MDPLPLNPHKSTQNGGPYLRQSNIICFSSPGQGWIRRGGLGEASAPYPYAVHGAPQNPPYSFYPQMKRRKKRRKRKRRESKKGKIATPILRLWIHTPPRRSIP